MKVGDLVRWRIAGDLGVILEITDYLCLVYCFMREQAYAAYATDLEVINESR